MRYFPTIELTPQLRMLLARGALRLQTGQWVRENGRSGRYLRTDRRRGVTAVSWVRPGDTVTTASDRFQRACRKGFVRKYAALYDRAKAERARTRHAPAAETAGALAA